MALIAVERSLLPHSVDHVCPAGSSASTPGRLFSRDRQPQQLHWMPPPSFSASSTSGRIGCCHVTYSSSAAAGVENSTQGRISTSGLSRSLNVAITSRLEYGGSTAAVNSSKVNVATRQAVSLLRPTAWPVHAAVADTAGDGLKWWERGGAPNMADVHSTQQFVDALAAAGDKLVIVEFFASWCPSCRALYPKFCKMATENSDISFLKVNFDENKPMCKSLNVKVLPYFHIYRGAEGRLEAFSCSLSKLQRLRDAIAKHHDGPCEDCEPPEVIPEALTALLEKRAPESTAAPAGSTD